MKRVPRAPALAFIAVALAAAVVLAASLVGTGLEGRMTRAFEDALSRWLGSDVSIGSVHIRPGRLEATDVRIGPSDLGARVSLDTLTAIPRWTRLLLGKTPAFSEVAMSGAAIVIEPRRLASRPEASRAGDTAESESRPAAVRSPRLFAIAESLTFDELSLAFAMGERRQELLRLRGKLSSERAGEETRYLLSATTAGSGSVEGEARVGPGRSAEGTIRVVDLGVKPLLDLVPEIRWHRPEDTRVEGTLSFSRTGESPVSMTGTLLVRSLGVAWEPVASSPFAADAGLELEGFWRDGTLSVEKARVRSGDTVLEWNGTLRAGKGGPRADLRVRLPETACQKVMDAIPKDLLGEFSGFALDGRMSGSLRLRVVPERPEETRVQIEIDDGCRFRGAPAAAEVARFRRAFVHRVSTADGGTVAFETGPLTPRWVALSRISPFLLHAVLAQEDGTFFHHRGFAPDAIEMALGRNLEEGRFASGASTVSMQLARNLFLGKDKTLARKLQEILLTWWLERNLSKREILELYLNVIEFGPGLYGIGAASRHYFGRTPDLLSPAEGAFLASVLPAPSRYHRDYDRGGLSSRGRARVERVLRLMATNGRIDERAFEHGLEQMLSLGFHYGAGNPPRRREDFGWAAPLPVPTAPVPRSFPP